MRLQRVHPRTDSLGDTYPSAVWGIAECPGLQIHKSGPARGGGWFVVLDRGQEGPIPQWVEQLAEQGHVGESRGLVLLFPHRRFRRLVEARQALEQASAGEGTEVLGQLL